MASFSRHQGFGRPNTTVPTDAQRALAGFMQGVPPTLETLLNKRADWPGFAQAMRDKARELGVEEYVFGRSEIPTEPIIPAASPAGSDVVLLAGEFDHMELEGALLPGPDLGNSASYGALSGRTIDELESFNEALGRHNNTVREFLSVRMGLEQMRLWIILHVDAKVQRECLEGITRGVGRAGALDPKKWYGNLRGLMEDWERLDNVWMRYIRHWMEYVDHGYWEQDRWEKRRLESGSRPPWLAREGKWMGEWLTGLIKIVQDTRAIRLPEVMVADRWWRAHLLGFGVVKSVFGVERRGEMEEFVECVEEMIAEGESTMVRGDKNGDGVDAEEVCGEICEALERRMEGARGEGDDEGKGKGKERADAVEEEDFVLGADAVEEYKKMAEVLEYLEEEERAVLQAATWAESLGQAMAQTQAWVTDAGPFAREEEEEREEDGEEDGEEEEEEEKAEAEVQPTVKSEAEGVTPAKKKNVLRRLARKAKDRAKSLLSRARA